MSTETTTAPTTTLAPHLEKVIAHGATRARAILLHNEFIRLVGTNFYTHEIENYRRSQGHTTPLTAKEKVLYRAVLGGQKSGHPEIVQEIAEALEYKKAMMGR